MYLIKLTNPNGGSDDQWCPVNKNDVVSSVHAGTLKYLDGTQIAEIKTQFDVELTSDTKLNELSKEVQEWIVENSEYADVYQDTDGMINLTKLEETALYFDAHNDDLFSSQEVEEWGEQYYHFHDGSNWKLLKIEDEKEVNVEEVDVERYDTGNRITYQAKNDMLFVVDSSNYQGSIDNVIDDYFDVIEEMEGKQ